MKEVTWSSGGLVLFIVKKYSSRKSSWKQPFCGTRGVTPTRKETEKENEIFSSSLSSFFFLRLLPLDKSDRKR